jgi:hypothetical protein
MTTHGAHQLLTMGVDKHRIIFQKTQKLKQTIIYNLCLEFLLPLIGTKDAYAKIYK